LEIGDIFGFLIAAAFAGFSLLQRVKKGQQESGGERRQAPWPGPVAQPPTGTGMPQPAWPPAPPRPPQQSAQPPQQSAQPPQRRSFLDEEGPEDEELVVHEVERFSRESERFDLQQIEGLANFEQQSAEFADREFKGLREDLASSDAATVTADETGVDMGLRGALGDPASAARALVLAEVLGKPRALRASHRHP
jgi:hypothetical protein